MKYLVSILISTFIFMFSINLSHAQWGIQTTPKEETTKETRTTTIQTNPADSSSVQINKVSDITKTTSIPKNVQEKEPTTAEHSYSYYRQFKFIYLDNFSEQERWYLLILLLFLGYSLPIIIYPTMLKNPKNTPGGAAAKCLLIGGFIAAGLSLPLMARAIPYNGAILPWYMQLFNFLFALGLLSVLGIFAFLIFQSNKSK